MTTFAASCVTSLLWASYELFAEEISRLSTSAAIVASSPIPSFTTSFESELRCCSGSTERRKSPSRAPPNTHTSTMPAVAMALICRALLPPCVEPPRQATREHRQPVVHDQPDAGSDSVITLAAQARSLTLGLLSEGDREQRDRQAANAVQSCCSTPGTLVTSTVPGHPRPRTASGRPPDLPPSTAPLMQNVSTLILPKTHRHHLLPA